MYDEYIKKRLLSREPRMVYRVIVWVYRKELKVRKRSMFRRWLSQRLDIPEETIRLDSLSHAQRKYGKQIPLLQEDS